MRQIWMTALASFFIVGFAAVVSAAVIAAAVRPEARLEGRAKMIEAEYQLALSIGR